MSSIRIFSGFGSSGQNRRPEKVPMKPSSLSTPKVKHASWLGTIPWRSPGRSSIGASTGAGGVETGPASSSRSQAGRTTERSAVVSSPLETKFLLFWVGQEQDSCPVAVTGTWLSTAADLLNYGRHGTPKPYVDLHDPRDFVGSATGVLWLHPSAPRL